MDTNKYSEDNSKLFQAISDPAQVLQAAIEKIHIFTQPQASRLELQEDGSLVARQGKGLERVIGLAKCYLGSLFSGQVRQEQEKKLSQIKQEILQARDILKSHSSLIEKLKEGDSSQKKLAQSALEAIQRYNAVVAKDYASLTGKYDFYNFERNQLLLDEEIKGQPIELPRTVSIKYDSHLNADTAQKTFKAIGETFLPGATQKKCSAISSTHKKVEQFMLDTFRMKAIRLIQSHLAQQSSIAEILNLVKQSAIEMREENDLIIMRQHLEMGPGSRIVLIGSFNQYSVDSKFMSMPIVNSFRLTSESTHSGFPYPSQHTGWALADKLTEAYPLRTEQVPLFQQVDQRKKQLSQLLLFDPLYIAKARQLFKLKRDIFDQNKTLYLALHRSLQEAILREACIDQPAVKSLLDQFYQNIAALPSAFEALSTAQEKLLEIFIQQPAKQVKEEWLENQSTVLRIGNPQEKLQRALFCLQNCQEIASSTLVENHYATPYIRTMGPLLGQAAQDIALQYLSEKIGFAPPMLDDFERKIQMCAFQQLISFFDELEQPLKDMENKIKDGLAQKYERDIEVFASPSIEDFDCLPSLLTNELEVYFNSRSRPYAVQARKGTLAVS